jgi:hypothetical protein
VLELDAEEVPCRVINPEVDARVPSSSMPCSLVSVPILEAVIEIFPDVDSVLVERRKNPIELSPPPPIMDWVATTFPVVVILLLICNPCAELPPPPWHPETE